ncbi:hypothetical protein MSG28_013461 [Choristoneura fumiferana]|uniref:Uncharacterized protein n=1 Tax=Choristoneura fumiferana TaxID=7141 RepID=A0ACC0KTH3_CHOFU|nr:hypothetical protein MSG28_013461 [Choristoneura fumiferana]
MAGRVLCWLAAAVALSSCRDGLGYDYATWPACPANGLRYVKRGKADNKITWLNLEHCNLSSLSPNELIYPGLERLDLEHNNIEFIENGSFDSLISLESVYLNSNSFLGKSLPSSLFRNCRRLLRIEFSNNDMSDTPADLLQGLYSLDFLDCDNCSLREMPIFITGAKLPIKRLSLNHNQLTRLENPATFVNFSNLDSLILESNKIEYLDVDLLKPLTKIRYISLMSNKIRRIPEQLFQNKSKLRIINLAKNIIDYIPDNVFLGNLLSTLDLSNNRLFYISENFFSVLRKGIWGQPQFYFDGNPLPCACLNELLVKLKQLNIYYRITSYDGKNKNCIMLDNFKCLGPDTYQEFFRKLIS